MKANYTIDLDEYETLFEIQRLHCGPSLCIRHVQSGCFINLLVLSNIAFTESSFQIFLEEIERISKLPPHPCIIRFLGLAKPHPNFYNSIGIGYEFYPKCFSLECIIGDILSSPQGNKIEDFSSTFGHNAIIQQESTTQNQKVNDNNKDISKSNSDNANVEENAPQITNNQIDKDKSNQDGNNLPLSDSNTDDNIIISTSEVNLNISVSNDSNFNNNDSFISNDNDLRFDDDDNKNKNEYDSNFNNNNINDSDFNKHNMTNDNELEFDNNNSNDNEINFDNDNNNDIGQSFDNDNPSNEVYTSYDDNQNNDNNTDFDGNNTSNEKLLNDDKKSNDSKTDNDTNNSLSFDDTQNEANKDEKIDNDDNTKADLSNDIANQKENENEQKLKNTKKKTVENESLLSHEQTLILLYGISNALSFLHQHGIIFMNLTISNILLDDNLEPKIQYYGITVLFEYFTMCCCSPIGSNAFLNQTNKLGIVNNYIINYNHIIRNIGNNDFFDFDGLRIVRNKCVGNVQNGNFLYLIRNLTNEFIDGEDKQSDQNEKDNQKSKSFLDRNLKNLIFVSPEVLKGQVPDKKNDVYAFSYLLFVFIVQERLKWILNFDVSFLNNILRQNRLALKSSIPILLKTMITRCWDSVPKCRPDISEVNWLIGELGQYFFTNHESGSFSQRLKRYEKFNQFKTKLPTIKREKNLFPINKNTKMLYDTVKQLPISINGQNYAKSVITLQSLLMNLRNSNLFDTLDAIVLNNIPQIQPTSITSNQTKQKKQKNKKSKQNNSNLNIDDTDFENDNDPIQKKISPEFYHFESLTDSDYESKIFNQLYFVQTKEGVYSLALNITVACTSRFKKILYYARLVSELYHGYKSKYPYLANIKKYLLSFFLTSLANYCAYPNALPIVALVFYCLQLHVYETNEMIDTINDFYEKYKNEKKISISILFCWFCPEIESNNPDLYNKMLELVKTQCQYDYFPYAFKKFINHIDKYKENNWSFYYNLRFDKDLHSYTYLLRNDDLSSFQKLCLENRRLINSKIDPDIFIPCIYAHHYPTSVMYTALFGSVRCCLFLLKNGARTASWDRKYRLLPSYSIAGGDENVFIHCLQSNKEDDSLMQTAVQFHRNYFFYRSFLMDKKMLTSMDKFGKSVMSAAAGSNNVSALIFSFVQKSCRDNFVESFGRTPLHVAAEQEMIDVLRVLLFLANDAMNLSNNSNLKNLDDDTDMNTKSDTKKIKITSKIKNKIASKLGSNKNSNVDDQQNENDGEKKTDNSANKVEQIVDVNARDSWGMTPLHLAADKMKRKSVKILFTSPYIDVNIKNSSGKTAVYYAVKTGDLKLVKLFLKNPKVDFCCQTKKGETPLHTAVKMERPDIVKLIIENRPASIYIPNSLNMSPFEMAAASNTTEISDIFHSYIMKKYEETNTKQSEQENPDTDNIMTKIETENEAEATEIKELLHEEDENEKKPEPVNDNDNNNDTDDQIITTEIPFINIDDGEDEKTRKKRKKRKGNDSDECVVF